ncbi:MAG: prepilin-type N-terminal cleavage/methylation domain-containing protein [Planctomycetota bacterium]
MRNHTTSEVCFSGFTLIEVIIAMVLLTIGTLTLLSVLSGGVLQKETSREYDIARNAAAAQLEEVRGKDFTSIHGISGTYFAVTGLTAPTGWTQAGRIEQIQCSDHGTNLDGSGSSCHNNLSACKLYDIKITVRWRIKGNTSASVYNEYVTRTIFSRHNRY